MINKNNSGFGSVKALYHEPNDVNEEVGYKFTNDVLNDEDMEMADNLYVDSLVQQAVDVPIRDSLEAWRKTSDSSLSSLEEELDYKYIVSEACINARKYGCSMIMPVLVDQDMRSVGLGVSLDSLLARKGKKYSILKFIVVKKFEESEEKDTDIRSDNFGKPKRYLVDNKPVHPSRVVIIPANSAGVSFIRSIHSYVCAFKSRDYEVTRAVQESNWVILKTDMKMLVEMASARVEAGARGNSADIVEEYLRGRLEDLRENANNNNAYGIDKEGEDIELISKTNIGAMIMAVDQAVVLLNAAVDIPMRRFMGRGVAGLGDNNDDEVYIQTVVGLREDMLRLPLRQMDKFIQRLYPQIKSLDYEWNKMKIQELMEELIRLNNTANQESGGLSGTSNASE